jgi:LPXTG-site transpeptidase (sortase) family protein
MANAGKNNKNVQSKNSSFFDGSNKSNKSTKTSKSTRGFLPKTTKSKKYHQTVKPKNKKAANTKVKNTKNKNQARLAENSASWFSTKFRKPKRYYLGNLLMFLSVVLFVFTYYPLFMLYLPAYPKPVSAETIQTGFYISIPKISAHAPIIDQVDPWNKAEYLEALKNGVALAKGFSKPGEKGTVYIFAHSSDSPWNISRYNTIFLKLGELQYGDVIEIYKDGKKFQYQVFDKKEVWPTEMQYIKEQTEDVLILQTCTPIGTSLKRLLIFARPA